MLEKNRIEKINISTKSHRLKRTLLDENPGLEYIFTKAHDLEEALDDLRTWINSFLKERKTAWNFYRCKDDSRQAFEDLTWKEVAAIRILDYIDHTGLKVEDLNVGEEL